MKDGAEGVAPACSAGGQAHAGGTYRAGDVAQAGAAGRQAQCRQRGRPVGIQCGDRGRRTQRRPDREGPRIPHRQPSGSQPPKHDAAAAAAGGGQAQLTLSSLGIGTHTITAVYTGDDTFVSSAAGFVLTVRRAPTTFDIGPFAAVYRNQLPLSATLTNAVTDTAVGGRTVTLTVSDGTASQSCPATTDTNGVATCTISPVTVALGHDTITATFAGDTFYEPTTKTANVVVFAFLDSGAFVLGDQTQTGPITFWGNQWAKNQQHHGRTRPQAPSRASPPPPQHRRRAARPGPPARATAHRRRPPRTSRRTWACWSPAAQLRRSPGSPGTRCTSRSSRPIPATPPTPATQARTR
jgi:hypothetical protein